MENQCDQEYVAIRSITIQAGQTVVAVHLKLLLSHSLVAALAQRKRGQEKTLRKQALFCLTLRYPPFYFLRLENNSTILNVPVVSSAF